MTVAIVLSELDNVATLLDAGSTGSVCRLVGKKTGTIVLAAEVPYGHKIALADIAQGSRIVKYGAVIGRSVAPIAVGAHVHVHNVESLRSRGDRQPSRGEGIA